jgi:hypothetical protein
MLRGTGAGPKVERVGELAPVGDAADYAAEGEALVVLIEGDARLGNSALLRRARGRANANGAGAPVRWLACQA